MAGDTAPDASVRNPHKPPERMAVAFSHTGFALSELRRGENSYDLSSGLALIWRKHLGPKERALMLATALKASEPRDALFLRDVLLDLFPLDDDIPPLEGF